jgi:signal transduction histidine kinase
VTVRLPLIAAAMIFFAAVASTQTAIVFMGRQADRQVETLGHVYLDGLSAALLPYVVRNDDENIGATLHRALEFHEGIVDRRLTFLDGRGGSMVEAMRPDVDAGEPVPREVETGGTGFRRSDDGTIWIWRPLADGETTYGTIIANLDISSFDGERSVLRWLLLLFDLVFAGICAVIGFFMVRRIQRPVATVAQHLYDAALGMFRPIEPREIPADDVQAERMILAFNAMAYAANERESLLAHLAEKQREADLGRLTATIAHEVKNPLGGMRTAISTLKRFGDREEPRGEAVEFLERGVVALEHVVDATLETYRSRPEWRPLSRQDFEDLRLLVEADGRSRDVNIVLHVDVPETVAVAALDVRQVVLNLLLNAVRASTRGSKVELTAGVRDRELVITVKDEGSGLDRGLARAIESGTVATDGSGLGVAVVIRLVERLQGRVAIESAANSGTGITLHIPLQDRSAPT